MTVRESKGKPLPDLSRVLVVTVGVHADDGAKKHLSSPEAAANDTTAAAANDTSGRRELTVADVATFNEFGTSRTPQRSFIRAWFDESQDFIQKTLQSQLKLVLAGKLEADTAAERIALVFEGSMKKRISRGVPPPNSPVTIARKGSSKPLIASGQLRNAIHARAVFRDGQGALPGEGSGEAAAE